MAKDRDKFVVAVKDTSNGWIAQGRVLGRYRQLKDARRDVEKLAQRAGFGWMGSYRIGIFQHGQLVG